MNLKWQKILAIAHCIGLILCFYPSIALKGQENKSSYKNQEAYLDSLWRREEIWQLGAAPIKDTQTIHEAPKWAKWDYDLEKYYVSQMKYPEELLKKNVAGYSIVMFSIDTLGLPREINILASTHKEFDKEVIKLTKELPHCLPCRDKNGKRMECLYTVYVPFLPQQYRDRVKADSIAEEELKHCFVEWEEQAKFQEGEQWSPQNYIYQNLKYDARLLDEQQKTKGVYKIRIDSYGEIKEAKTIRSCGISQWDEEVERIIRKMPRWTPTIYHRGKGRYKGAVLTIPVVFKNDSVLS
ncbi:TonB family domain protein [Bacteroides sp. 2_1_33B]|nr:TonB family domain protein [Bacteroides sp. 2_1_33B]